MAPHQDIVQPGNTVWLAVKFLQSAARPKHQRRWCLFDQSIAGNFTLAISASFLP